jgi:hypothetical protein
MKTKTLMSWFAGLLAIVSLSGCAFGVTNVRVTHSALTPVDAKREGVVMVRQFTDSRKEDKQYIGTKRNGFGMPLGKLGVRDGKRVDLMVTEFFVDALKHAGYNAMIQIPQSPTSDISKVDAVMEGDIREFWTDLYMATWHKVNVHMKLLDKTGAKVMWERDIEGGQANVLWLGLSSEFEKVVRQALDQALNRAAKEFASDEFYQKVRTRN